MGPRGRVTVMLSRTEKYDSPGYGDGDRAFSGASTSPTWNALRRNWLRTRSKEGTVPAVRLARARARIGSPILYLFLVWPQAHSHLAQIYRASRSMEHCNSKIHGAGPQGSAGGR